MKILFSIILIALVSSVKAGHADVTNITNVSETNITEEQAAGVAMAIALGQHQFDWGTDRLQGSISAGNFDDETAGSFALAKRIDGLLLNGSVGHTSGETAVGVAAGWRW